MKKNILILILCVALIAPVWAAQVFVPAANGYTWVKMSELEKIVYMSGFLNGRLVGFIAGQYRVGKKTPYPGSKESTYYVKEVDAFLQTYPLCKKVELHMLFPALDLVWFEEPDGGAITYKQIGEDCSNGTLP